MEPEFVQIQDNTVKLIWGIGSIPAETLPLEETDAHFRWLIGDAAAHLLDVELASSRAALSRAVIHASELQAMLASFDGKGTSLFEGHVTDGTVQRAKDIVTMVVEHVKMSGRTYPNTGLPFNY